MITNVILPVFFIIFLGFLLGRLGKLDVKAISRVQLYALSPALIFVAMARAEAGTAMILRVLLYVALMEAVILILVQGIGFLMRRDREERNAMSLASVFMNAGFYGIPVCLLAFGELGLVYATTFVVAASIIQSTVGIYIASAGRRRPTEALAHVFKVPLVYALVLGRVLASLDALPPEPFMKMIGLLGQAAIPVGLILLGLQLERIVRRPVERPAAEQPGGLGGTAGIRRDIAGALISAVLRILGGFTVALMLIRLFDFEPVLRNVIIVESAMPTAVNVVVYATEFGCRPKLVALGILFATVASILSITLILNYLT